MSNLKTAIIGAGPAGLTLARILEKNNINCTVFELDATPQGRDQGGTVDLHGNAGQLAIREAGLMEEFQKASRPEGMATKLVKYDGTVVLNHTDGSQRPKEYADRPEIDRRKLRDLFLASINPETVKWNRKLLKVEPSSSDGDKYDLHFTDGIEQGFDLVVGAEGAWSKVRDLLTDQKPFYSGVTLVELWALDVEETKPWVSEYVGKGSMYMFDEGRGITAQRCDQHLRAYAGVRKDETWLKDCGIDWSQPESAKQALIKGYFDNCGEDLKRLIIECNDALITRTLYMLPPELKWAPRPGITVIGDAAHLMTPFGGVGANLAMLDALFLAKVIINSDGDKRKLSEGVKQFETEMFERAEKFGKKTLRGLEGHFSADGVEERARMMQGKLEAQMASKE